MGTRPLLAGALSETELQHRLAVFGDDFLADVLESPVVAEPSLWIQRPPGEYVYRLVQGAADAEGNLLQRELHVPDPEQPDRAWKRYVGEKTVESFLSTEDLDVLIVEEVDHQHGFRVEIEPGVHWPAGIHRGDEFVIRSRLDVYPLEEDLFYARGVGLVAELESTRASALIVFHVKEDSAKVLVSRPSKD